MAGMWHWYLVSGILGDSGASCGIRDRDSSVFSRQALQCYSWFWVLSSFPCCCPFPKPALYPPYKFSELCNVEVSLPALNAVVWGWTAAAILWPWRNNAGDKSAHSEESRVNIWKELVSLMMSLSLWIKQRWSCPALGLLITRDSKLSLLFTALGLQTLAT